MVMTAAFKIILMTSLAAKGGSAGSGIDLNIAYNPRSATVIQCTIDKVFTTDWRHDEGSSEGLCLKVKRGRKFYTVIVAPLWHVGSYMNFKSGDTVTISGSLRMDGKKRILVARWIKKKGRTLHLRTIAGVPHWESNGPVPKRRSRGGKGRGRGSGGKGGGGRPSGM